MKHKTIVIATLLVAFFICSNFENAYSQIIDLDKPKIENSQNKNLRTVSQVSSGVQISDLELSEPVYKDTGNPIEDEKTYLKEKEEWIKKNEDASYKTLQKDYNAKDQLTPAQVEEKRNNNK